MCAINGFNFKNEELIRKMNQITSHRGPDATGVFLDDEISLGHNRLSIIDLSEKANQPMHSFDNKQIIIFNGEIYNFKELKNELQNYPFKTESDTEVILAAYKKWGNGCVKKFNGIFAFAIWDNEKKELYIARDHIGVKPLYYHNDGGKFIFSSEIKGILEHGIERVLDMEAFNHYLRVLYVPEPLTMFKGIYKFPPASFGIFKNGNLKITHYWAIENLDYLKESKDFIKKELQEKVFESVKKQLISDRPLGIYLSGGIDSSVVLDSVSRIRNNIDTFSVGFDLREEEERDKFNQDFYLARKTAKFYNTNHHEVLLSPQDVLDIFEKTVYHLDEPISNATAVSMMKLAEFAKSNADVILGGDGGDELFGGYDRYRLSLISSYYQKIPGILRKIVASLASNERLKKLNLPAGIDRFALFMFQKDKILQKVIRGNILTRQTYDFFRKKYFSAKTNRKFEELFMNTDRRSWLVDESLMMTDKMSMSFGLEARVPLLDKELVEFAWRIPLKYKVSMFNTKIILKESFRGRIPDFLFNQPKRGWFSPAAKWLRHPKIYAMVKDALSRNYYKETAPLFKWDNLEKVLKDHHDRKEYNLTILWAILIFQTWAKQYNIQLD